MSLPPEANISALLDDDIAPDEFDAIFDAVTTKPVLIESFRSQQYVRDALGGNACPDRHYTARIMAFIARAESKTRSGGV
jgi:hypothetical protein